MFIQIPQLAIFCATLVILALIVLSGYRCSKQAGTFDPQQLELIVKGNRWYYVFIASLIITVGIFAFSHIYHSDSQVLNFISLASSIISIILAVVTIIYSFTTNSNTLGNTKELSDTAKIIKNEAHNLNEATKEYQRVAKSLDENISNIINSIQQVDKKTDSIINGLVQQQNSENTGNILSIGKKLNVNSFVSNFLNEISPMGHLALYACVLGKDSDKSFTLNIFSDSEENDVEV